MTEFLSEHPYHLDVNVDLPFCSGQCRLISAPLCSTLPGVQGLRLAGGTDGR